MTLHRLPRERLDALASAWRGARIAVIGDVMSDRYLWGTVTRVSPEAPVPIVEISAENTRPGGAANVARTIAGLGGDAHVVGVVGDDAAGEAFLAAMLATGLATDGIVADPSRPTTVKTRIIAHNQHLVRADRESRAPLAHAVRARVLAAARTAMRGARAVVLSDYGKGVFTSELLAAVLADAAHAALPVFVDPKDSLALLFEHHPVSVVSLNETRAAHVSGRGVTDESVEDIGRTLRERIGCDALILTRGARGLCVIDRDAAPVHIGTVARAVYDVTGAGDTVVATTALAVAAGATYREAATMANHAAGLVVAEIGTAAVNLTALLDACTAGAVAHAGDGAVQGALADHFARHARTGRPRA